MEKKLLGLLVACILAVCVWGCGSTSQANEKQETNIVEASEQEEMTEAAEHTESVAATKVVEEQISEILETESEMILVEETETVDSEEAAYIVAEMSAVKYAKSSVNVRKGPSKDYEKVGTLSTNQEVKVIGQADSGWYQIELGGEVAYVSKHYLVDEKVVVVKEEANNTSVSDNNGGSEAVEDGISDTGSALTPSTSEPVESKPSAPGNNNEVEDESMSESTGNLLEGAEIIGGGTLEPWTDGYGDGTTIEIGPTP